MSKGSRWLWLMLALTLAATGWLALEPDARTLPETVAAVQRPGAVPALSVDRERMPSLVARVEAMAWPKPTESGLTSWGLPPSPKVPAVVVVRPPDPPSPPPPPQAPPFPYRLIGRLEQGELTQALLTGPMRSIALRKGDVVDGQWRVDKVDATSLNITWLPGQLTQQIGYGNP